MWSACLRSQCRGLCVKGSSAGAIGLGWVSLSCIGQALGVKAFPETAKRELTDLRHSWAGALTRL